LVNQNYFSNIISLENKLNIAKIRTNAHNLHNETSHWANLKSPRDEQICKICDTNEVEDEHHFHLAFPTLNNIGYNFNKFHNLLTLQNLLPAWV